MKIYEHVEAVPSRIVGLFNLLFKAGRGGLEEGMAKALLQPKTLREADAPPSALAPRTIDAAIETGLVARSNVGDTTILALAVDAYETLSKSKDRPDSISTTALLRHFRAKTDAKTHVKQGLMNETAL